MDPQALEYGRQARLLGHIAASYGIRLARIWDDPVTLMTRIRFTDELGVAYYEARVDYELRHNTNPDYLAYHLVQEARMSIDRFLEETGE